MAGNSVVSVESGKSTVTRLQQLMVHALYKSDEVLVGKTEDESQIPSGAVLVQGLTNRFAFHPGRLEETRAEIVGIIRDVVQDHFFEGKGDGGSFLQLFEDRNGQEWAEHRTMQELCLLSIGLKLAEWCAPYELWEKLPGGFPCIRFDLRNQPN